MRGDQERDRAEPAGLHAVYLAHRSGLVRFLRARGAGDAADDLVQELWIKLKGASSRPIADPLGYLYRAANNLMISRHRSVLRSERREGDWHEQANDNPGSLEQMVIAREQIALAEERLRALGPRAFRIFMMFRVNGIPQRAIADELNISLSTVEKDLQRAYRAIAGLRDEVDAGDAPGRRL